MATLIDRPDRFFQLWAYTVGMGRLPLRSTKSAEFQTRIDVLFQTVTAIKLSTTFPGLVVAEADDAETELITGETGLVADAHRHFYSITASTGSGYVVAGVVATRACLVDRGRSRSGLVIRKRCPSEDAREFHEASELWRSLP